MSILAAWSRYKEESQAEEHLSSDTHYRQAISQTRNQSPYRQSANLGDFSRTLADLRSTEPVSLPCKGRAGSSVKSGEEEEAGGSTTTKGGIYSKEQSGDHIIVKAMQAYHRQ